MVRCEGRDGAERLRDGGMSLCASDSWRKDPQIFAVWLGGGWHPSSTPSYQGGCQEFRGVELVLPIEISGGCGVMDQGCLSALPRGWATSSQGTNFFRCPMLESLGQHPLSSLVSSTDTVIASCFHTKRRELKSQRWKS